MNAPKDGKCFNCSKPCTDEDYCFGCKHFICEKCGVNDYNVPMGSHEPGVHLDEPYEEGMRAKELLREVMLDVMGRREELCMDNHEEREKLAEALADQVWERFRVFPKTPSTKEEEL